VSVPCRVLPFWGKLSDSLRKFSVQNLENCTFSSAFPLFLNRESAFSGQFISNSPKFSLHTQTMRSKMTQWLNIEYMNYEQVLEWGKLCSFYLQSWPFDLCPSLYIFCDGRSFPWLKTSYGHFRSDSELKGGHCRFIWPWRKPPINLLLKHPQRNSSETQVHPGKYHEIFSFKPRSLQWPSDLFPASSSQFLLIQSLVYCRYGIIGHSRGNLK